MKCPQCGNLETSVIDSRITEDNRSIRRRRECDKCHARFTTFERMEFISFLVQKRDGKKEIYDRNKLEKNILKACNKRDIDPKKIDSMLNQLENEWGANKKAITSKRIGKDVLSRLKNFDEIAFIRFASVYHKFENLEEFMEFIKHENVW